MEAPRHSLRPQQFAGWIGLAVLVSGIDGSIIGGIAADSGLRSGRVRTARCMAPFVVVSSVIGAHGGQPHQR